jgi:hypothetical protein
MESENPEEVNVIAEGTEPEEPAHLALGENRAQDTLLPSIQEPENNNLEEAADELPLAQHQTTPLGNCLTASSSNHPTSHRHSDRRRDRHCDQLREHNLQAPHQPSPPTRSTTITMDAKCQSRNQQFDLPLTNNHTREQATVPAATACSTARNLPQ